MNEGEKFISSFFYNSKNRFYNKVVTMVDDEFDEMLKELENATNQYRKADQEYWNAMNEVEGCVASIIKDTSQVVVEDDCINVEMETLTPEFNKFKMYLIQQNIPFTCEKKYGVYHFKLAVYDFFMGE